jgi:hypothetical protein
MTSPGSSWVFAGFRFPREVISVAVRWYLRYGLSDPTSATLVRKSAGAVDRFEGLAEVVGEGSAAVMVCGPAWISMVR